MAQPQLQVLPVPLQGLDQSAPTSLLQPGKLTTLTNGTMLVQGAIEPRPGFTALANAGETGAGNVTIYDTFTRDDEVFGLSTDGYLCQWSHTQSLWRRIDRFPEAAVIEVYQGERGLQSVSSAGVAYTPGQHLDAIVCGQWLVTVFEYTSEANVKSLLVRLTDLASTARRAVYQITAGYVGSGARLLKIGTIVYLIYQGAATEIHGILLNTATIPIPSWSGATVLGTLLDDAFPIWEAHASTTHVLLVYNWKETVGEVSTYKGRILKFSTALVQLDNQSIDDWAYHAWAIYGETGLPSLCYVACDDQVGAGGVLAYGLDYATWAVSWGPVVVDAAIYHGTSRVLRMAFGSAPLSRNARLFYSLEEHSGAASPEPQLRSKLITDAGIAGDPFTTFNVDLQSQPYYDATLYTWYVWALLAERVSTYTYTVQEGDPPGVVTGAQIPRLQGSLFLLAHEEADVTTGPARPCCRLWPLSCAGLPSYTVRPVSFDGSYVGVQRMSDAEHGVDAGFSVAKVRRFYPGDHKALIYGKQIVLAGGLPATYDGNRVVELGWNYYPRMIGLTSSNAAGLLTPTCTYTYKAIFTWVDNLGNRHYSASSLPQSVTLGAADDTVTVDVDCYTLTARTDLADGRSKVEVEIYRNINYLSGGVQVPGTEFYRVGRVFNNVGAPNIQFVDGASDAVVSTLPMIMDRGGVYAAGCTPPLRHVVSHQGRLFGIRADEPDTIVFGHPTVKGDAPRIPDGWEIRAGDGGEYNALGPLDDKLLAWQDAGVDCVWGQGPNEQGKGQIYPDPVAITRIAGAHSPSSVVRFPGGYLYVGRSGVWSIDGSLSPKLIGAPVQDSITGTTAIASILLDERRHRILISKTSALMVWHYKFDLWATWVPKASTGAAASVTGMAVRTYAGAPYLLLVDQAGRVLQENATCKDADDTRPTMDICTGWLAPAGLQAWTDTLSVTLLGTYRDAHGVNVYAAYDYDISSAVTHARTATQVAAAKKGVREQLRAQLSEHEIESVMIQVSIVPTVDAATGRSCRIESLALETAAKPGVVMPNLNEDARM